MEKFLDPIQRDPKIGADLLENISGADAHNVMEFDTHVFGLLDGSYPAWDWRCRKTQPAYVGIAFSGIGGAYAPPLHRYPREYDFRYKIASRVRNIRRGP
jgi:hypothetical protein